MKILIPFLLAIIVSLPVSADDTKNQKIRQLLDVMNVDATLDAVYAQIEAMQNEMYKNMTNETVSEEQQALFERHTARMMTLMKEEMNWATMEAAVVEIYAQHLNEQEVADMLSFYQSESGQSILAKMPALTQDTMMVTQQMVMQMMPKIQALSKQLSEEFQNSITQD